MDSSATGSWKIEADGLRVAARLGWHGASLRHFTRDGMFATAVRDGIGQSLPLPLQAVAFSPPAHDAQAVLAWRSPTETLFLCSSSAVFAQVERRLADAADGCMVDQTGGISMVEVQGRRAFDLLQRIGGRAGIPALSEARGSRMAEVHVLTACIQPGEYLLLVERVYAAHLAGWVRATAADMG